MHLLLCLISCPHLPPWVVEARKEMLSVHHCHNVLQREEGPQGVLAYRRGPARSICQEYEPWGNVCPARARRATFLLTIPTSAPDLPSSG